MKVSIKSRLTLYPLSIQKDKKNYIVEEPISGDFFEMPKICIDAIEGLDKGETIGTVETSIKQRYPDEKVNMIDFVEQLIELGLVHEVDGVRVNGNKEGNKIPGRKSGGFTLMPSKVGRLFFNRWTNKVYLLLFLLNILFVLWNPEFFPHYEDIFLFDSMVMNMLTYLFISLILIFIHEFGHILAIRSYDLPAKLSIGNRLIFIVFETDLTPAWKLASRKRNILYFAGMAFEQVIIFLAFCLMLLFPNANFIGVLGIVVFDIFIKTLYQCCFYMKTDVYYVVENITGCYNLMESGKEYLRSLFRKGRELGRDTKQIFQDEWKIIRLYSVFYVVGVLLTFLVFFAYFLPQLYYVYTSIFSGILNPGDGTAYWDAVAFIVQTVLMAGLLVFLKVKQRR